MIFEVHFCDRGDLFVFDEKGLLWSPYGRGQEAELSSNQEKVAAKFRLFNEARLYATNFADNAQAYLSQLDSAERAIRSSP